MQLNLFECVAGEIEECGDTYVCTAYLSLYRLPIVPLRSAVVRRLPDGAPNYLEIPLCTVSVVAGYLRTWGLVLAVVGGFASLRAFSPLAVGILAAGLSWALVGWRLLGRLDRDGELRRLVYSKHAGGMVDIGHFGARANRGYVHQLRESVAERARGLSGGYRGGGADWVTAACAPDVLDTAFLEDALCLSRYELAIGDRAMAAVHDAVWEKLRPEVEARAAAQRTS